MLDVAVITRDKDLIYKLHPALTGMGARVTCYASLSDEPALWESRQFDVLIVHDTKLMLTQGSMQGHAVHRMPFAVTIALLSDQHMVCAPDLLDAGFDRCLSVSSDPESLCAMVRALTRRRQGLTVSVCHYGPLSFNFVTQQAFLSEVPLALSVREAQALQILLERVGQIIPKARFMQDLAPDSQAINGNAAEVYIHRLRKKISDDILPVRNIKRCGYLLPRYDLPVEPQALVRSGNQLVAAHLAV